MHDHCQNLLVERPGAYEFALRRWPERTHAALGERYEPSAKSPPNMPNIKTVGFLTIARAHVAIAGREVTAPANPKATGATVRVTLPSSRTTLKAWFSDAAGKDLCGAFFVTVTRKG